MPHTLTIQQHDTTLVVDGGETILEAALRAGLDFPFDCRSGVCGECKCMLITGAVEMKPYLDVAMEDEERLQGFILGCRSTLSSDIEIALLDRDEPPTVPYQDVQATVCSAERATHDIIVVRLKPETDQRFVFLAGQYANVQFTGRQARNYSFANAPGADHLEFHIRAVPGGAVSPDLYANLKSGDTATIRGPRGMAYLRQKTSKPVVLCAGGSGLAPILSMVRMMAKTQSNVPLTVLFGVRSESDIYLEDELRALLGHLGAPEPIIMLSNSETDNRRRGFLADAIADRADYSDHKAYLCGPPVMVKTCRAALLTRGVDPKDCHADVFWSPPRG